VGTAFDAKREDWKDKAAAARPGSSVPGHVTSTSAARDQPARLSFSHTYDVFQGKEVVCIKAVGDDFIASDGKDVGAWDREGNLMKWYPQPPSRST
jgi:hypothetical protein